MMTGFPTNDRRQQHSSKSKNIGSSSSSSSSLLLDELDKVVQECYVRETESPSLSEFELSCSSRTLSARDVEDHVVDVNAMTAGGANGEQQQQQQSSSCSLLSLLEEWRNLIAVMKSGRRGGVFVDAAERLWTAFDEVRQRQHHVEAGGGFGGSSGSGSNTADSEVDSTFRHSKTLVSLMSKTAAAAAAAEHQQQEYRFGDEEGNNNHHHSDIFLAMECRFVTLLEVLLSYTGSGSGKKVSGGGYQRGSTSKSWTPSDDVRRVWEVWDQPELPADLPPVNFRRKAYRVLVSLPWVPSSRGLLEACSFDVKRHRVTVERCPPPVRRYFDRILGSDGSGRQQHQHHRQLQPRYDCVSRILNMLREGGDRGACTVIHSIRPGTGKTTLAALAASHPAILTMYRVLWLALPEKTTTYETYTKYLDDLSRQLSIHVPKIEWPECVERFEEPALHRLREDAAMERARDMFAEALADWRKGNDEERYLLVLDDVENDKEIELFRFSDRLSIIATTQSNIDAENCFSIEISPMCEEELIDLFLTEANFPSSHVLGLTTEVRSVIKKCGHHPLTVRTVGRWYGLKRVTAGTVDGLDELLDELSSVVIDATENFRVIPSAVEGGRKSISKRSSNRSKEDAASPSRASTNSFSSASASEDPVAASDTETEPSTSSVQQENWDPGTNEGGDTKEVTDVDDDLLENGSAAATNQKTTTTSSLSTEEDDRKRSLPVLFGILNRILVPKAVEGAVTSVLFTRCMASMAVAFPEPVPLDSVILLWEQLILVDSIAVYEIASNRDASLADIRRRAWMVAQGLSFMGLLSIVERKGKPWVEVHHNFYRKFATRMARETLCSDDEETYERSYEEWNKAYVTSYFTHRLEGMSDRGDDLSWEYAVLKLPSHANRAKMFAITETILGEDQFFRGRVGSVGWDSTIDMYIKDCIDLQRAKEKQEQDADSQSHSKPLPISPVFNMLSVMASTNASDLMGTTEDKLKIEVARVLYKIGFGLASNGRFDEAVEQFESALNLLPQSDDLVASILYGGGWVLLAANMSEKAIRKLKASRKMMEEHDRNHVLYKEVLRLQGEALIGECEYREAADLLQDLVGWLKSDDANNMIELGTSLSKMGRLQYMMGDIERARDTFNECLMWKLKAGESSADLSLALSLLGDMNVDARNLADARGCFQRALQILDSLGIDPDDVEHTLLRAKLEYLKGDFSTSLEALETARQTISQSPVLFLDQSAYDLRCIARYYYSEGELAATTSVLQDSLILTNQRPYSIERSYGLHDLARCILDQSMTREALVLLEQSLEIRILKLGECSLVMDTFHMIGRVHMLLGSPDEALPVFEKVQELTNRLSPDDKLRNAKVLFSIGDVMVAKKEYTEAKAKILNSMALLDGSGSHDSPDVARALHRLGDVETAEKQLPIAFEYYTEALRIRKMHPDKRETAETLHSLGVLNRKRRNFDSALEPLLEALDIRRELGIAMETAKTVMELGHVHRLRSEMDDAVRYYEECIELLGDAGECDALRSSAFLSLGHAKLSLRRDSEVLECYERALATRMEAFGRDHMKTANVHRSLGLFQYLVLHGDEALLHLNEYMRVTELGEGVDSEGGDVDYALALMLMFDIHRASGRNAQGKNLIELAKEVCDDSDEVRQDMPALAEMVSQRRSAPARQDSGSSSKKGGLFARLANTLIEESGNQLAVNAKESSVLRNIGFIDD